ncbi:MAG TPA: hypothetical protein VGS57_00655 [Thermoanaerobaculia bacterium]|jgi:hypothetical protein|nr:hypothetical protein [Thermoanaerobaculia bacterium]
MRGSLAGRFTRVAALGIALGGVTSAAPLRAAEVFVPALNPVANDGSHSDTELWISNPGASGETTRATFLAADTDGTQRGVAGSSVSVLAKSSVNVTHVAQSGKFGLVVVEVGSGLLVEGRIVSTSPTGGIVVSRVPVISDANKIAAGAKAELLGLERNPDAGRIVHFGVVNLGTAAASCQVAFFRADGSQVASTVTLTLKPVSLLHFQDALGILDAGRVSGVRGEVSCNQPFYAYGAIFGWPSSHYLFVTPSATVASSTGPSNPPSSPTSIVFERAGLVHEATTSNPKGTVNVAVPRALSLKRLVLDMDVVPGPWNREKTPGNHAIVWLYRGKFRSNTVANINAFGPNKYTVKASQNIDLEAGNLTASEGALTFQQGTKYHVHYVYDAENALVTTTVSSGGQTLRSLTMAATAGGRALTVAATGMIAEFGHYYGQEGPEVASPGWKYFDLRIEMIPN